MCIMCHIHTTCPDMYVQHTTTITNQPSTSSMSYGHSLLPFVLLVVALSDMLLLDIALIPDTGVPSFLKIPV